MEPELRGKNLLVTGGAGFIGSAFVRAALAAGAERVVVLDLLTYAAHPENLRTLEACDRFELIVGDLCDPARCRQALDAADPHWVVHLAAESHVDRSIDDPAPFLRTNVVGTGVLLEACLERWEGLTAARQESFRFLHSSTDEVFGDLPVGVRADESTPYRPSSPYSASKAASDHLVRSYGRTFGLPWIIPHSGNNFGPRQFPEKLVPLAIARALAGEPVQVYGDGLQVRDWIHVEDHCSGLLAAGCCGLPFETYCLGGEGGWTNLRILDAVLGALGRPTGSPGIVLVEDRPGHDRRYALDSSRIRERTGWAPQIPIVQGIGATVAWYRDHLPWLEEAQNRADYRGERLGLRDTHGGSRA
ncbi:MAG: dTDP-glucose 4,6-dehydratase [Planctomycetes bacterium]|nr:dTDP-glucose 4,6-dehydratase [Planctomycetota bacterium]